jgi:type II secretory pathway pseudopilin PulG
MRILTNQNGFTYILALTIVMIMGIMLGMVGQSWKTIKQREQEKELLFRGSQIKEAIENWYNPQFKPNKMPNPRAVRPLMDLKQLFKDENILGASRYLPQSYEKNVNEKDPKCAPDCAKLKIYQDPMTGKEWTIIRGVIGLGTNAAIVAPPGTQGGGIIGVASKSDETPFRTDFKDTALESLGTVPAAFVPVNAGAAPPVNAVPASTSVGGVSPLPAGVGGKPAKYSEWQFIAESPQKNDHTKIHRAYHEGW